MSEKTPSTPFYRTGQDFQPVWTRIVQGWYAGHGMQLRDALRSLYQSKPSAVYAIPCLMAEIALQFHTNPTKYADFLRSSLVRRELHRPQEVFGHHSPSNESAPEKLQGLLHVAALMDVQAVHTDSVLREMTNSLFNIGAINIIENTDPFIRRDIQYICEQLFTALTDTLN